LDNETLKTKATELYESGIGYIKIASELGINRDKVRRLLGKKSGNDGNRFKPSKLHVPLELRLINILADTQMRVSIDHDTVDEYADALREGAEFPAVSVFTNGLMYWLADGFHRYYAAREAAVGTIIADVYQGTLRDAQMYAMGANANHGLRRTNADKRHAVEVALADEEWGKLPNTEIAKMCGVTESFVRKIKTELSEKVEKNSHNAIPGTPAASNASPEHQADIDVPQPSARGKIDLPAPEATACSPKNPPTQSGKEGYKWAITFNCDRGYVVVTNLKKGSASLIFQNKCELETFISELKAQVSFWDEPAESGNEAKAN
jgi:hypothetical protein